jgi:hypothetical protein
MRMKSNARKQQTGVRSERSESSPETFRGSGQRPVNSSVETGGGRSTLGVLVLDLLSCALILLTCGCTVLSYTSPNGERFTRSSLGATTSLSSLTVEADTNGVRHVELRGYTNDSSQALGTVTEAAVRAAIQGAR